MIALANWIVWDGLISPDCADPWIARDAKLSDIAGAYAEETGIVEEACSHQIIEAIRAVRSPGAACSDYKVTPRSFEI